LATDPHGRTQTGIEWGRSSKLKAERTKDDGRWTKRERRMKDEGQRKMDEKRTNKIRTVRESMKRPSIG